MNLIVIKLCIVIMTICIPQFNCFYTERFFRERQLACNVDIQTSKSVHESETYSHKTFYLESDSHSNSVLAGNNTLILKSASI